MFFNCNGDFALVWTWKGTKEVNMKLHFNLGAKYRNILISQTTASIVLLGFPIGFKGVNDIVGWKKK